MGRLRYRAKDAAIRIGRILRGAAIVVGCAGGIAGVLGGYSYLTTTERLAIQDIVVEGATPIRVNELKLLAGVDVGENLLGIDLAEIQTRIQEHPWVARATVTRDLPHRLRVIVAEREPVMILALDQLYYVDETGVAFKPLVAGDSYDFPVLAGLSRSDFEKRSQWVDRTVRGALDLLESAEASGALDPREISEVVVGDDGYSVRTVDAGLMVHVGRTDFEVKFKRLARVRSVGGTAHARRVDLRFDKRVVVARGGTNGSQE